ncbi:MAG: T9SS type A sorting domain-containing protein [Bacteroidetes bacterium]|nr:T9SS type A sorting domain-containing protein [Bacteroidota bacterium]
MSSRILFLIFVCLFSIQLALSQAILSATSKSDLKDIDRIVNNKLPIPDKYSTLNLSTSKKESKSYFSFVCKSDKFKFSELVSKGYWVSGFIGNEPTDKTNSFGIFSLRLSPNQLQDLYTNDFTGVYVELSQKNQPTLEKALKDTRADSVHLGIGLPEGYTGKDVYIGITDWGFDYTSPMFYDTALQESRIVAAWDQFKTSGPAPLGYGYGTEYNTQTALQEAGSDTSNIYSFATHGTHVAGIAGGSGAGTPNRGMAFESKFLFVTFLVDEAAVLDAWEWMYQKALADGKRLVVNMSWGLYHFGTLDGTSLLSQAITAYSDLGVVFANSAGNNGNVNFHIKKEFNNDLLKSKIDFYPYSSNPNMWGQSIHAWGEPEKSFSAGILVNNNLNSLLVESPLYSTDNTTSYIDTFLVTGTDTIWYNISADSAHSLNNRPTMRLRVKNTNTSLKILLKSTAINGIVHYWNVTELTTDVGNWGMPFSASGPGTVAGDNLNGVSEPSCSDDVISVAAYATQYQTPGGSNAGGAIASFSSFGPRYDGVMKPDIAAPGVSIISSMSSFTDVAFTSQGSVDFNGRTYHFAKLSGTSMASPMVAGIAALLLDANPYLSAQQVKEILMQTARQDNYTGSIPPEGSNRWGAGKVNAYAAVQLALQTIGQLEIKNDISWLIYPNPAKDNLNVINLPISIEEVEIIDQNGKVTYIKIKNNSISLQNLGSGSFWIRVLLNGKIQQQKFIKL